MIELLDRGRSDPEDPCGGRENAEEKEARWRQLRRGGRHLRHGELGRGGQPQEDGPGQGGSEGGGAAAVGPESNTVKNVSKMYSPIHHC